MLRSIADDGSELSVNAMPLESLYNPMTSIPVHFECGYDTEYTFNFNGMGTFENATSIWMEDLQTGDWISITETNPTYTCIASPGDDQERFLLHFMGPTAIFEADVQQELEAVQIFSAHNTVYIRNASEQVIKEIVVYNLLGQEILRNAVPGQSLHQFVVHENSGYYVVRVRTDQSYAEKVFIK